MQYEIRLFSGAGCQKITGDYFGTSGTCYTAPTGSSSCVTTMATYLGNNQFNVMCCSNTACNGGCTSYVLNRYSCYTASQLWFDEFEYDLQGCGASPLNATVGAKTTRLPLVPAPAQEVSTISDPIRVATSTGEMASSHGT